MHDLNPQQRAAVLHLDGPLLVLAGAGSGKTRVITYKIVHLIRECGLDPARVAAITFTNKAAREMKERAGRLLERGEGRGLTVSTFHTFGLEFIRREHKRLGIKKAFSIFDATDSLGLLRELTHRDDTPVEVEAARHRISRWKNDLVTPEAAHSGAQDDREVAQARLYARYEQALRAYSAVDFDDLIVLPVRLLEQDPETRERWQNRLRHLLVDEYQDTNACQYRLVKLLVGVTGGLTAVGDDDQSIYAWRGARPENLAQLERDFPRLQVIKLEQNYRSTNRILSSANRLIALNPHVHEKRLWSTLGEGEPIRVLSARDAEHEAVRVVGEIMKHRFRSRGEYRDYAILYRGNHQSRPFEKMLREQGIPYKVSGGQSFFERAEVKDVMAYLRLLANPDDDAAFLRIVNVPRREIGTATLEKLGEYATRRHVSLYTACFELGLAEAVGARALTRVQAFADTLRELAREAEEGDPAAVARKLVADIGYEDWLIDQSRDPKAAARRMENVNEVLDWMTRLAREGTDGRGIGEIVAHMTLMDILDRNNEENQADAVQLMTLHAAKGLEFPHVFLVGMEEDLLPHRVSIEEENLEEERRLCYVGITRAQQTLTITHAEKRTRFGETTDCEPSRFLAELPAEHLEWPDAAPPDPEQVKLSGRAHLA
ncbi:MAG: DNA helicase Rep, partial [Ectothiorhodospiraceae bacterium]|nr:DNA helicase Rep [Ectothiorhodospiraceae bacterium]